MVIDLVVVLAWLFGCFKVNSDGEDWYMPGLLTGRNVLTLGMGAMDDKEDIDVVMDSESK